MALAPQTATTPGAGAAAAAAALAALKRPRVLLVEDEALLALDLAQQLDGAGFEVMGPAASVGEGRELLADGDCQAAILDVNLRGETSEPIAHDLIALDIPIVVVSGYARSQHPAVFQGMTMLVKPVRIHTLVAELRRLLQLA